MLAALKLFAAVLAQSLRDFIVRSIQHPSLIPFGRFPLRAGPAISIKEMDRQRHANFYAMISSLRRCAG